MIHFLKTDRAYFQSVVSGLKTFEVRYNDRDYQVDDFLVLKEWDNDLHEFTGLYYVARIVYILSGYIGLKENYVVLSIAKVRRQDVAF